MFRTIALTAVAAGAGLTLAACGGSSAASSPSTAAPVSRAASAPASASAPAATDTTITATETEFHISMATSTVTAGTYTFTAQNAGRETHALSITGPGGVKSTTGDIAPGSSGTMTVKLVGGTYDVFCPVADHKMLGMNTSLTVS